MKHKDILIYTMAFLMAFALFFGYVWWTNHNNNTLPSVYGVM